MNDESCYRIENGIQSSENIFSMRIRKKDTDFVMYL